MEGGLDELIESLLTEIAFSGNSGCSVTDLLNKISSLEPTHALGPVTSTHQPGATVQNAREENVPTAQNEISNADDLPVSGFASKVWTWLAARNDVYIGQEAEFNRLSLSEILQLPDDTHGISQGSECEDPIEIFSTSLKEDEEPQVSNVHQHTRSPLRTPRPRVFLSDEQQWRLITGHGPDLKRVPKFEWLALVDIASTREEGILQGDLVRITGQDKRSLPTRTDALAAKGYIIKQSILIRGCRSSKLWLSRFADSAAEDAKREGLPFEQLDLSHEALTCDLDPLPFCNLWNNETVDYLAIAQAFVAVTQAWGVIRYCDLRTKLGIEQKPSHMRALSKTSRFFTDLGVIRFLAARFQNGSRVFKDCVKFIREPTPQEWKEFRAVPRNRIQAPSQRLGKRGEAYRANLSTGNSSTHKKKQDKKQQAAEESPQKKRHPKHQDAEVEMLSRLELAPLSRCLQKPFPNTIYEIIKRAGDAGSSNTELAQLTLGHNYKKMIAAVSRSISATPRSVSSEPFRVISHKHRVGKIDAYRFFSTGPSVHESPLGEQGYDEFSESSKDFIRVECKISDGVDVPLVPYGFSEPPDGTLRKKGPATLSQLAQVSDGRLKPVRKQPRKSDVVIIRDITRETPLTRRRTSPARATAFATTPSNPIRDQQQPVSEKRPRGRPPKAVAPVVTSPSGPVDMPMKAPEGSPHEDLFARDDLPSTKVITLGVSRAPNNSLDPPGRKGRPKKSYVVVMRSPRLRDASFLGDTATTATTNHVVIANQHMNGDGTPGSARGAPLADTPSNTPGVPAATAVVPTDVSVVLADSEDPEARTKPWKCSQCGKRWKNSNGLEYHQKVARVPCNPNFTPVAKEPTPPPPPSPQTAAPAHSPQASSPTVVRKERKSLPKTALAPRVRKRRSFRAFGTTSTAQQSSSRMSAAKDDLTTQPSSPPQSKVQAAPKPGPEPPNQSESVMPEQHARSFTILEVPIQNGVVRISNEPKIVPDTGYNKSPIQDGVLRSPQVRPTQQSSHATAANGGRALLGDSQHNDESYDLSSGYTAPAYFENRIEQLWANDIAAESSQGGGTLNSRSKPVQQRSERVRSMISFLLKSNNGVFPGDQSLLLAIESLWNRRYTDTSPPDEKILRRVVNKMERDGQIAQSFYSFFDDQSKAQNISVLMDSTSVVSSTEVSTDPRVLEVKEGIKKSFPKPYLPPDFHFVDHGPSLMDDDTSVYAASVGSPNGDGFDDVEILQYAMPVMADIGLVEKDKTGKSKKRPSASAKLSLSNKRAKATSVAEPSTDAILRNFESPSEIAKPINDEQSSVPPSVAAEDTQNRAFNDMSKIDPRLEKSVMNHDLVIIESNPALLTPKVKKKPGPKPGSKRKASTSVKPKAGAEKKTRQTSLSQDEASSPNFLESSPSTATQNPQALSDQAPVREKQPGIAHHRSADRAITIFAASRSEQEAALEWIYEQHLPIGLEVSLRLSNDQVLLADLEDNDLGDFERSVDIVRHWELKGDFLSVEAQKSTQGVFINHGVASLSQHLYNGPLQWLPANQLDHRFQPLKDSTAKSKDQPSAGQGVRRSSRRRDSGPAIKRLRVSPPPTPPASSTPRTTRKAVQPKAKVLPKRPAKKKIDYKLRSLASLPPAHQGRTHKRRLSTDRMGLRGETDIISAFVIFKILGGGVDRNSDYGMVLKLFPEMSHSGLKRFWGRVSKERKVHIEALSKAFPKAFLAAYEQGELAPLDYGRFEEYDWLALVKWTSKLRLYDDIELPAERADFDDEYTLEEPVDQVPDWREIWFSVTSLFNRIDANAGKAATLPAAGSQVFDDELVLRARSWIRSLTRTNIRGAGTAEKIRRKLLELCHGDEDSTNELLQVVLNQLTDERFATRTKGKRVSQSIRMNANFSKQFEKNAHVDKFGQAVAFKEKMDAAFREGKEFKLSYGADDGSTLAMLNLQAHGRVHVHQTGFRHIPMGHEPGNYEGRKFPKNYYHFKITMTPSETYLYSEDMPGLEQALLAEVPKLGPRGEIPVWVNLFGKVDLPRWIEYLCTFVFAAATRGPVTAHSICLIFKPAFELFEAQLILNFVDRLGLLRRLTSSGEGVTVGEWWWLVVGTIVGQKKPAEG